MRNKSLRAEEFKKSGTGKGSMYQICLWHELMTDFNTIVNGPRRLGMAGTFELIRAGKYTEARSRVDEHLAYLEGSGGDE